MSQAIASKPRSKQFVITRTALTSDDASPLPINLIKHTVKQRLPTLALLARTLLGIPATQVKSERLNSTSGNIATARRATMHHEHVVNVFARKPVMLSSVYFKLPPHIKMCL